MASMKIWVAVAVLAVGPLSACGPSKELRQVRAEAYSLRTETDSLRAEVRVLRGENKTLKSQVEELEDTLAAVSRDRDELKVAAERPATAPGKKAGRK
jgi:uncharacterized protein YlxW (UPF0749 family)